MAAYGRGHSAPNEFVDIDGLRIRFNVGARGAARDGAYPLLLIMGLGGHLGMWRPLQRLLGDVETITFDAPGAGASTLPAIPLRMSQHAGVVTRLLDRLGYGRVDVMGVSLGGALAQELTHQAPHRVRRLILAATAYGIGSVPGDPTALMKMALPFRYYSRCYFERQAPSMYGGRLRDEPDLVRQAAAFWSAYPPSAWGYFSQIYALWGWCSLPWLHRIEQPTLVLSGDDDPIVPLINSRILAGLIPHARLRVVRGGHLFLMERAEEVAPLIRGFLEA
ncbi:MAG: alpha/beta fold hydrolase [Chloroflexi bacterium]|nr:alpha/beta fold hydrolase [Chloroflexota bacterium]